MTTIILQGNGDSKAALEHVRSDDNMSDHSAGSYDIPQKKSIELNCQMKGIISKVKVIVFDFTRRSKVALYHHQGNANLP